MQNLDNHKALNNFILDSLPIVEFDSLLPRLKDVELQQSEIIYRLRGPIQAVYFPSTCLLSWTNSTDMGEIVEVGTTGNEGLAGVTLLLDENILMISLFSLNE